MSYADLSYYKDTFLGAAVADVDFPRLALRASEYLDDITENRIDTENVPEAVKKACCAVAEMLQQEAEGGVKASESLGGYSVSYAVGSVASVEQRRYQAAAQYLRPTGLLYRGYDPYAN